MTRMVERLLRLHPGEGRRALLLFIYLFLVISSLVASKAARDALFLGRYRAVQLPYGDIGVALLVVVAASAYIQGGRRVGLRVLQVGTLLLFSALSLTFWWFSRAEGAANWLFAVIYIWVGLVGVLAPAQVWMLANFVLTTRAAKRTFGLIGSGAIAGSIAGGLLTQTAAQYFGTESTLLGVALALAVSAALVVLIWRDRPADIEAPDIGMVNRGGLREGMVLVWESQYLRAIAALIMISAFVTTIAGWQFKAIAKEVIPETDALATFFGRFNLYAGIISLCAQLVLTSRLLRTFGIGFGLFLVPTLLAAGTAGVLITGGIVAAVLLKGSDQVFRYSIDKATVELMFLPVPIAHTFPAKSFIDTVVWRFGDGFAGLLVLFFAAWIGLSPVQIGWVNLFLIGLWMYAAFTARRHYVRNLTDNVRQHRLDMERASGGVLDRTSADIIAEGLVSGDTEQILAALDVFETQHRKQSHPAMAPLLRHAAPEVRKRAIRVLGTAGDTTALPAIELMLHDERLEVRTEALLYLTKHAPVDPLERIEELGGFADYSITAGMIAFLAHPGERQNLNAASILLDAMLSAEGDAGARTRREAARLLASLPDVFDDQLKRLLHDSDSRVAREAVITVGTLRKQVFTPDLIDHLGDPLIVPDAQDALAGMGEGVVGTLNEHLSSHSVPREIRREIPELLMRIDTPSAFSTLFENLGEPDTRIRFRIITALNKLSQLHPAWRVDMRAVESVLNAEIVGLYRSYQIMGAFERHNMTSGHVIVALRDAVTNETERIFRLLKVVYPEIDLHSAYVGLQSMNLTVHDNALELVEAVLSPRLRELLVPLLDGAVPLSTRVQIANRLTGATIDTADDALRTLAASDDEWVRLCAALDVSQAKSS